MATLTLVDEGTLRVLPPDNMTLRLFTNDLYLTHFSIASDFTFDATHDKNLTQGNWTATNNTTYIGMTHTSQSYSFTSSATYYGFAYVLASGYVYFAAKFDTPWTVINGTTKYITPYIQISNYNVVPANSTSQGMEPGSLVLSGATPGQLKVEDDATHLVQGVVLGNLVISGGTLGDSKVLGAVPTSLIQGVTIGDITIVGSSIGNVKTVAVGASTVQGITKGAFTFNGLSTGNKYAAASAELTYVGAGSVSTRTTTGTLTPALPSGLAENDLLCLVCHGGSAQNDAISGYTAHQVSILRTSIYVKTAGSSESAPTTPSLSGGGIAFTFAVRGSSTPTFDVISSTATEASGAENGAVTAPSVTTTAANDMVFVIAAGIDLGYDDEGMIRNSNPTWATPSGFATTSVASGTAANGDAQQLGLAVYRATKATAGATGTTSAQFSVTGTPVTTTYARTIAFKP